MSRKITTLALALGAALANSAIAQTYQIVEIHPEKHRISYGMEVSDSGKLVISAADQFRPLIDLTQIDFESDTVKNLFDDVDAVRNADSSDDLSDDDYTALFNYVTITVASVASTQKITQDNLFLDDQKVKGFDELLEGVNDLSGSTTETAFAINSEDWLVGTGSAPYKIIEHTNNSDNVVDYQVRSYVSRAFVDTGSTISAMLAPDDRLGGSSRAFDINNNNLVVGQASVDLDETVAENIDKCNDDEEFRGDRPVEFCISNLPKSFIMRGYSWSLDSQGTPIEGQGTQLGVLSEVVTDQTSRWWGSTADERIFTSVAFATNNQGVIVGNASQYYEDRTDEDRLAVRYAVVYKDGVAKRITDPADLDVIRTTSNVNKLVSSATDINDENIAIGYAIRSINGSERRRLFIYDVDSEELTYPDGFFPGSSTYAKGINNAGLVVGDAEIETQLTGLRRRHAFVYDTVDGSFSDLNDFIACDSPYTIVEGNGINENGEIAATALINRKRYDINGKVVVNDNGEEQYQDVTVAVKLIPQGGSAPTCTDPENPPVERQGGSFFWLLPVALVGLLRKRLFK